jgi:hypothetical protein
MQAIYQRRLRLALISANAASEPSVAFERTYAFGVHRAPRKPALQGFKPGTKLT